MLFFEENVIFFIIMYYKKNVCYFFVECYDNYFGWNCVYICNVMCRSCNKIIGVCDNGCYFGWIG